ncbi:MAG: helix-turn-helix domain-containing protein, partial [Mycobacteriales bacterium]
MDAEQLGRQTRRLAAAIEPFAGQVYFSPECHAEYAALGFGPSPASSGQGVALPDGPAYFTSRGAILGQVPGTVVAAAFGVFNPAVVTAGVTAGWSLTDAATIAAARDRGSVAQLTRVLGPRPDGIDRTVELLTRATADLRPAGRP